MRSFAARIIVLEGKEPFMLNGALVVRIEVTEYGTFVLYFQGSNRPPANIPYTRLSDFTEIIAVDIRVAISDAVHELRLVQ